MQIIKKIKKRSVLGYIIFNEEKKVIELLTIIPIEENDNEIYNDEKKIDKNIKKHTMNYLQQICKLNLMETYKNKIELNRETINQLYHFLSYEDLEKLDALEKIKTKKDFKKINKMEIKETLEKTIIIITENFLNNICF